jgi:hypothetical protein
MKNRIREILEKDNTEQTQHLISKITSDISPKTNQLKKSKLGSTPVIPLPKEDKSSQDVRLPYVPIKETESAVPTNAMGASSPSTSGPIAMPEKLLRKKPLKRKPLRNIINQA